ncbi:hypothetical protein XHC_1953 [Xanthomonas hortorum pv. carotae str. M081]|nr:hypothetical protein XHC_1953 [Xanthomonas hortorum pv. carotae str. M081]
MRAKPGACELEQAALKVQALQRQVTRIALDARMLENASRAHMT